MKTADFAFDLPAELIAQEPLPERSASRLLAVEAGSAACSHLTFRDLPQLLTADDLLVFNNTRVIPARLFAQKQTGGRVEILIERVRGDGSALAHVRASKSPRDGALLCAVGADSNHSLVVYRWQTGTMLASSKGSPEKIVSVNWSPFQDYVVTCGIKHLAFWSTSPFESRKAVLNKKGKMQTMLCSCFPGPDTTVVGTQDGSLYLFKGYQLATNMRKAHAVTHAVHATRDMVISGGKEGKVKFWTVDLMQCLKEVVLSHPNAVGSCIKSMHLSGSMLLLGTRSGEIYEMDTTSYSHELLLQGHGYGTIWGLATHPRSTRW